MLRKSLIVLWSLWVSGSVSVAEIGSASGLACSGVQSFAESMGMVMFISSMTPSSTEYSTFAFSPSKYRFRGCSFS